MCIRERCMYTCIYVSVSSFCLFAFVQETRQRVTLDGSPESGERFSMVGNGTQWGFLKLV